MGCPKITYRPTLELQKSAILEELTTRKTDEGERSCFPFGSQMVGRGKTGPADDYRYGFNGKEKDENGMGGGGSTYDYGFRIYNPQIAKFLSVDPLTKSYPMLTPYQFASNTPIQAIDLDGLEAKKSTTINSEGYTVITITIDLKVKNSTKMSNAEIMSNAKLVKAQIESSFTKKDNKSKVIYKTTVNLTLDNNAGEGDFYLDYVTEVKKDGKKIVANGRVDEIGNTEVNRFQILAPGNSANFYADDVTSESAKRTGAHEVGHGLGLKHPKSQTRLSAEKDKNDLNFGSENLMYSGGSGAELNNTQLKRASNNIKEKKTNDKSTN